ncbi:hypothetical protein GUJ93_ZPchr0003g18328 [Zizania palustris]|uniref:Mitochondrial import inner membrane translocase subunit TIM50 n=1 Tax=Zizania palustris TaxID=103762 RepID=A0A8J5SH49_ZIZPA|nr:hypothetical protein GUJ93_ZPchr0003g18328 [Zizania palustris]
MSQKAGCYLGPVEANMCVESVHNVSNQLVNSNETKKRNFHRENGDIADVNIHNQSNHPECPEVKNTGCVGNSEQTKKRISPNQSSFQNSEVGKGTENEPSLNPISCPHHKCSYSRLRKNETENKVAMTDSFLVDNAKAAEGESVNVDSAVEKKYRVVQPGLSEERETNNFAKCLDSCMLESNKNTNHDVYFMPRRGSKFDVNVNTNYLHSTAEEKVSPSTVGDVFMNNSGVAYNPYSAVQNQRIGSFMKEATMYSHFLHPSLVRGGIDSSSMIFPSVHPMIALDPFNQGFNLFQSGHIAPYSVSDVHHGLNIYETGAMWNREYELGRSCLDYTSLQRNKLQEKEVVYAPPDHNINYISRSSLSHAYEQKPPRISLTGFRKKKLLILDLNGLLADINQDYHNSHMAEAKVRGKLVFRRPYCHDFLSFCLQNFELGIWSSRKKQNVDSVVDILMRDFKPFLLFCWDMSKCTFTGHKTLENIHKPLILKELRKLWNKEEPDLPWEEGDYSPYNTLLVDDSPYKALCNPPHTAIFPRPYSYLDSSDRSLGPGGDLRVYLENLAFAEDVEGYVRNNPFGQPFITHSDPDWSFYAQIVEENGS